jgi:hypothetical protein
MMSDPTPRFEPLESRWLMSTSVFLGLDCLPAATHTSTRARRSIPAAIPPISVVIPQATGSWTGSQVKADNSTGAELSLTITSRAPAELNGKVDFHGPRRIRWAGQMLYNDKTGHLSMYFLSSTLIAKVDAALVTDPQTGTASLQGTIEYFTPDGSYSATLSLLRTA